MTGSYSNCHASCGQTPGGTGGRMLAKVRCVRHVPGTKFWCRTLRNRCQAPAAAARMASKSPFAPPGIGARHHPPESVPGTSGRRQDG